MAIVGRYRSFIILIIFFTSSVKCELFSAIAGLEQMLEIEKNLLENINEYLANTETELNYLNETYIKFITKRQLPVATEKESQFFLIKYLVWDWDHILNLIKENVLSINYFANSDYFEKEFKFPTNKDFNGAIEALMRLQQTYQLNATDLANGQIKGIQSTKMSVNDCFFIGYHAFVIKNYHFAIIWFETAIKLFSLQTIQKDTLKVKLLKSLAKAHIKEKNFVAAERINDQILAIDPDDEISLINEQYIKNGKLEGKTSMAQMRLFDEDLIAKRIVEFENPMDHIHDPMNSLSDLYEVRLYEAVCRGDIKPTSKQLAPLRCRYVTNNVAFLKIAPFKLEEMSLEPYIVVYHDVIYDNEIEVIKNISQPQLERAGVTSEGKDANKHRISKSAFLEDNAHKFIADISTRSTDLTGMTMKLNAGEDLQVVNYGIGGFYSLHYDFTVIGDNSFDDMGVGNRIATLLFYMSDVTFGGGTAFPAIKTAIPPKKGSAVLWWNLYKSAVRDLRTMHAGCPVLIGSKWVSNKWIHSHHQELLKPCGLKPDHPPKQIDD